MSDLQQPSAPMPTLYGTGDPTADIGVPNQTYMNNLNGRSYRKDSDNISWTFVGQYASRVTNTDVWFISPDGTERGTPISSEV